MDFTELMKEDVSDVSTLALKLWPDSLFSELSNEFGVILDSKKDKVFICNENKTTIAFAHFSLRSDYVEGTKSSPVAYLEGIFVEEDYRKKGIAQQLVQKGISWAKKQGCSEMASDTELENNDSQSFHKNIGFEEANRIVCFNMRL